MHDFFVKHKNEPFLMQAESTFQQVIQMVGPANSAKGNLFELVIVGSLMAKHWTVGQLLDTFLSPNDPRPAWCGDIAGYLISFLACGSACDYGYKNDLEWFQNAQVGRGLMPSTSTGPGYLCLVFQAEWQSSPC